MDKENQKKSEPYIYVVILNWNNYQDTYECIKSLQKINYSNYRLLVVDNGSTDSSTQQITRIFPNVETIYCPVNRGIAAGYNRGIEHSLEKNPDYIVVMNNDLTFHPNFLMEMVKASREFPHAGIIMPKILYSDFPNTIWSTGGRTRWMPSNILLRGRNKKDGPKWQSNGQLDFAPSCCLLLKRELCQEVKFDEEFFFYYDDWDFCVQASQRNYKILFASNAHIWHKVSRSTMNGPKNLFWWTVLGKSCVRYHKKHHDNKLMFTYVGWVIIREILKLNAKVIPSFLLGVKEGMSLAINNIED